MMVVCRSEVVYLVGMLCITIFPHFRHIYKLTDFGAARELQEEEQFVSLYGTEEYLVITLIFWIHHSVRADAKICMAFT
jgi:hypothetical protein